MWRRSSLAVFLLQVAVLVAAWADSNNKDEALTKKINKAKAVILTARSLKTAATLEMTPPCEILRATAAETKHHEADNIHENRNPAAALKSHGRRALHTAILRMSKAISAADSTHRADSSSGAIEGVEYGDDDYAHFGRRAAAIAAMYTDAAAAATSMITKGEPDAAVHDALKNVATSNINGPEELRYQKRSKMSPAKELEMQYLFHDAFGDIFDDGVIGDAGASSSLAPVAEVAGSIELEATSTQWDNYEFSVHDSHDKEAEGDNDAQEEKYRDSLVELWQALSGMFSENDVTFGTQQEAMYIRLYEQDPELFWALHEEVVAQRLDEQVAVATTETGNSAVSATTATTVDDVADALYRHSDDVDGGKFYRSYYYYTESANEYKSEYDKAQWDNELRDRLPLLEAEVQQNDREGSFLDRESQLEHFHLEQQQVSGVRFPFRYARGSVSGGSKDVGGDMVGAGRSPSSLFEEALFEEDPYDYDEGGGWAAATEVWQQAKEYRDLVEGEVGRDALSWLDAASSGSSTIGSFEPPITSTNTGVSTSSSKSNIISAVTTRADAALARPRQDLLHAISSLIRGGPNSAEGGENTAGSGGAATGHWSAVLAHEAARRATLLARAAGLLNLTTFGDAATAATAADTFTPAAAAGSNGNIAASLSIPRLGDFTQRNAMDIPATTTTHPHTHTASTSSITTASSTTAAAALDAVTAANKAHPSIGTNFAGILSRGISHAPPAAPVGILLIAAVDIAIFVLLVLLTMAAVSYRQRLAHGLLLLLPKAPQKWRNGRRAGGASASVWGTNTGWFKSRLGSIARLFCIADSGCFSAGGRSSGRKGGDPQGLESFEDIKTRYRGGVMGKDGAESQCGSESRSGGGNGRDDVQGLRLPLLRIRPRCFSSTTTAAVGVVFFDTPRAWISSSTSPASCRCGWRSSVGVSDGGLTLAPVSTRTTDMLYVNDFGYYAAVQRFQRINPDVDDGLPREDSAYTSPVEKTPTGMAPLPTACDTPLHRRLRPIISSSNSSNNSCSDTNSDEMCGALLAADAASAAAPSPYSDPSLRPYNTTSSGALVLPVRSTAPLRSSDVSRISGNRPVLCMYEAV